MNIKRLKFIDKTFIVAIVLIITLGLVVLLSASSAICNDSFYYVKKQILWLAAGTFLAVLIIRYDYTQLERYWKYIYGISVIILVTVLVFGKEVRGTTGWIAIGPLPMIQPAEFTKILLILAFADFLARRKGALDTLGEMLPCFIFMGVPFLLIMAQPDLGTALVYIAFTLGMMFVAGANWRILLKIIGAAVGVIALALFLHFQFGTWLPLDDYQIDRLIVFADPYNDGKGGRGAGWNTIQSLVAIGSGGLTGKGLFHGTQVQLNFLPEHHTDFIYAVIGEELGFIGAALVIVLYGIILWRTVVISFNAQDLYGSYLVLGISAMWLFHIFENIGMSIGVMPITGIPLPFLSYGGSAMITNMIAVGLVLSVNIRGKKIVF
ncbi:Rod shape-determining protein RodA [Syntrophomonas zehnderi OL-4]|uniref:Peptidoglycan glycosyltransferase RodA n=1 Tax=Syntrophomonas zehnderi OL-4 TaxID=690567 RepID=A0A0E4GBB3_9FIRM|nr:rod shape-determining protein RodA [Syntrophomonas zehnderi]CFX80625.1 Rod shape-determining protein RodA [Syntrophomonas zehnderi OL-4]